jgi:hypothetical protein
MFYVNDLKQFSNQLGISVFETIKQCRVELQKLQVHDVYGHHWLQCIPQTLFSSVTVRDRVSPFGMRME